MLIESRVVDERTFVKFERNEHGEITGRLIRIMPSNITNGMTKRAQGTYMEYATSACANLGDAELEIHAILEQLREAQSHS